jgi:hypothetical protein
MKGGNMKVKLGRFFLLHIIGDIEPFIKGSYKTEKTRDQAAIKLKKKVGDEDGIFKLDMVCKRRNTISTIPKVKAYSAGFMANGVAIDLE